MLPNLPQIMKVMDLESSLVIMRLRLILNHFVQLR